MPNLELSADELRDAVMASRAAAQRAQRDASANENPKIKAAFAASATRQAALSEKFESARRARDTSGS
jgi:hypothetical protein